MSSQLTPYEKETIINFNMEESTASVYTCEPRIMNRLDKLCKEYPEHYKFVDQDEFSKTYEIASKRLISFRPPKRELSEEEKQVLRDRALQMKKDGTGIFSSDYRNKSKK